MEELQNVFRNFEININLKNVKRDDDENEKKELIEFTINEEDDYSQYNETYDFYSKDKYKV